MRIWNELFDQHPRETGPLVGWQIRYLVSSAHGFLVAFGFAVPPIWPGDRFCLPSPRPMKPGFFDLF